MSGIIMANELARADVRTEAQLVEVRSVTQLRAGHIPGAINLPMDEIESRLADLGRNRTIVLICQAGRRGRITAEIAGPPAVKTLPSSKVAPKRG